MDVTRYRAAGTTDDITTCEHCGKDDLKSTVRMVVVDPDGNNEGELFAGSDCAARLSGRPVGEIRTEARAADKAASEARARQQQARHSASMAAADRVLARLGLDRNYRTVKQAETDPEYVATMAAWDTESTGAPD